METIGQPGNINNNQGNTSRILSIAGLCIGIITLIFSLIPCVGYYALVPAIIGVILSGFAMYFQKQESKSTQLSLVALMLGILATGVAYYQYVQFKTVFDTKARAERIVSGFEEKIEKEATDAVIDYTKEKINNYLEKDSIQESKDKKQEK